LVNLLRVFYHGYQIALRSLKKRSKILDIHA
jgi:hypothetical protein